MNNVVILWIGCLFLAISCTSQNESRRLDEIEAVMNANTDSVLNLLAEMEIPTEAENLARYNMLTAWEKYRRFDSDFDIDGVINIILVVSSDIIFFMFKFFIFILTYSSIFF